MILRETITISSSVTKVWGIVTKPSLMPLWNPKCTSCTAVIHDMGKGSRYGARFRMSGPEHEVSCEVIECVPERLLKTRFSGQSFRNSGYLDEVFELHGSGSRTMLVHEVDFSHSGVPWLIQVLVKLIDTFGYSVGKSSLDGIKDLAESAGGKQPAHPT